MNLEHDVMTFSGFQWAALYAKTRLNGKTMRGWNIPEVLDQFAHPLPVCVRGTSIERFYMYRK